MTLYKLYETSIEHDKTYGIVAVDSITKLTLRTIPDISVDKAEIEKLIAQCNNLQLDIIHLNDIIYDFLCVQ